MERYVVMLRTDPDDRDITEEMLAVTGNNVTVKFIADPAELPVLVASVGQPSLILLNDKGAAHAGYEQLRQLKSNPASAHIPVIVLGEMSTREYIRECYKAGANSFIIKPSSLAETQKKIAGFFDYWFHVAET